MSVAGPDVMRFWKDESPVTARQEGGVEVDVEWSTLARGIHAQEGHAGLEGVLFMEYFPRVLS